MNSVRSNNVSLKYQRFATFNSKDIGIINSELVAKTQFLFQVMVQARFSKHKNYEFISRNVIIHNLTCVLVDVQGNYINKTFC